MADESEALSRLAVHGHANPRPLLRKLAAINKSGQANRAGDASREDSLRPQLLSASQAMTHLLSVQRSWIRNLLLVRPLQDLRAPITSTTAPSRMAPMLSH